MHFLQSEDVLIAVGICTGVCLALTIFAMQTKWDFTACGGILFVCVIILFIFGIVAICIPGKTMSLVYASLGALLFSVYLVFDTQLMLGGKHKYSISPEEYIFAALNLYLDIINIFLYILALVGGSRN
jgi:FtsH-binding integral membrane protein